MLYRAWYKCSWQWSTATVVVRRTVARSAWRVRARVRVATPSSGAAAAAAVVSADATAGWAGAI